MLAGRRPNQFENQCLNSRLRSIRCLRMSRVRRVLRLCARRICARTPFDWEIERTMHNGDRNPALKALAIVFGRRSRDPNLYRYLAASAQ
jgi:hypothetical protein